MIKINVYSSSLSGCWHLIFALGQQEKALGSPQFFIERSLEKYGTFANFILYVFLKDI